MKKICVFAVLLIAVGLNADVIKLTNGDSLQGKLVTMEGGQVVFKSNLAGKVTIDQKNVASLELSESASIKQADGSLVKKTGKWDNAGLAELGAINPAPPEFPKTTGNVTAGITRTDGNSYSESGSISFNVKRETEKNIWLADAMYSSARSEDSAGKKYTTEEYLTAGMKNEINLSDKSYAFLDGRFKKDHIADLDQRLIGTVGYGYRFYKTAKFKLNADIGLSEVHEEYTVAGVTDKEDALSARLGYNLDWVISDRLSFKHNLEYYPSTESKDDYYASTLGELRYRFSDKVYGSFKALLDYDATPAGDNEKLDTKYILGIGVDF